MSAFRWRRTRWLACAAVSLGAAALVLSATARGAEDAELHQRVEKLVRQLDADERAQRDDAEKQLIEAGLKAGVAGSEAFIALLPTPNDDMPQELQTRLVRIRGEVQTRLARQAVAQTRVTLDLQDAPLEEALKEIEKQTGNRVIDYREKFGQETPEKNVTLKVDDVPFWSAIDQLLDATNMSPYDLAGEDALALIAREQGSLRRFERATYSGPFRIEVTNVTSQRGLRSPEQSGLQVELEISWEPRVQPMAMSQAAEDMKVRCDDGRKTPVTGEGPAFDVEAQPGSHSAQATLALQLPAREAKTLKSIHGKMTALVPGKIVNLKFDNLAEAHDVAQESGGVTVTLERVVKNQALWEVHMHVHIGAQGDDADASRGWVFQNLTFLEDKKSGEKIDHAGYETTMQSEREAGFAYFFELPDDIGNYTWVYRTPAAIVNLPVEYELNDVPLP